MDRRLGPDIFRDGILQVLVDTRACRVQFVARSSGLLLFFALWKVLFSLFVLRPFFPFLGWVMRHVGELFKIVMEIGSGVEAKSCY